MIGGEDAGLLRVSSDVGGDGVLEYSGGLQRHTEVPPTGVVFHAACHPGGRGEISASV